MGRDLRIIFDTASFVYVRGTRDGYNKMLAYSPPPVSDKQQQASPGAALANALSQRNNITQDKLIPTVSEEQAYQQSSMDSIANSAMSNIQGEGNAASALSSAVSSLAASPRAQNIQRLEQLLDQLEQFYSSINGQDKLDLYAILDPSKIEGAIVNVPNGEAIFNKVQSYLKQIQSLNRELNLSGSYGSSLGSAIGAMMANNADRIVLEGLSKVSNKNIKFVGSNINPSTISGSYTAGNGAISYTGTLSENSLTLREEVNLRSSSLVNRETGKLTLGNPPAVKNTVGNGISQSFLIWQELMKIYGSSNPTQNYLANNLVWRGHNAGDFKQMTSKIVAENADALLSGLYTNSSDSIIVNGRPILISSIMLYAKTVLAQPDATKASIKVSTGTVGNTWQGSDRKDLKMALNRSNQAMDQIRSQLRMTVNLKGNILYDIAKGMI